MVTTVERAQKRAKERDATFLDGQTGALVASTAGQTPRPVAATDPLLRSFPGWGREAGEAAREHSGRALYSQQVSGSQLVVEFMKYVGADHMFGIPGGASLPLSDALTHAHLEGAFRYVLTGHEQGAAFEAEGYAAASGKCGWCTGTSGPGATNLITGLADAYRDSRPVIALTGNTATTAEPEAFQAIDIVGITDGKATKASYRPQRPEEVQELIVRAYHTAMTGRPGAVLFDLPKDVQLKTAAMRPWEEVISQFDWSEPRASDEMLIAALAMLCAADRPVIYAGQGVVLSNATEALRELASRLHVPVTTTVHALGALRNDDPLNLGMLGMHGKMVGNIAPYMSDLTINFGARFDDRVVGAKPDQFAPHSKLIHVDIDARQLNRVRKVDLAIHSDVRYALTRMLELLDQSDVKLIRDRLADGGKRTAAWRVDLEESDRHLPLPMYEVGGNTALSHESVYASLGMAIEEHGSKTGRKDLVATFDVGTHQMKGAQWFPVSQPRSFVTSGGMGSMACSLPMAVGAHFARPEATIIAVAGDGGFVMSSHELDTIGSYRLPVKIIVFDDAALGMVTNWHGLFFEGRDMTSDRRRGRKVKGVDVQAMKEHLKKQLDAAETSDQLVSALTDATCKLADAEWPLFAQTAASYAIPSERVRTKTEFNRAIRRALATDGPYFIQVMVPSKNQVYPLMEPGTTPQDMVWREIMPGSGARIYARDLFDYAKRRLRYADDMVEAEDIGADELEGIEGGTGGIGGTGGGTKRDLAGF
ncbi:MAG TPA: thiamine pyrophosphate-dependent enzyme [Chloroflexota bacterium]|nr:thiamine pyrophosphate-dependent enzyme [Chloroflexota bacterium]